MPWGDIEFLTAMARLVLYLLLITSGALFIGTIGCLLSHHFGDPHA
jgi:hypothetical protein